MLFLFLTSIAALSSLTRRNVRVLKPEVVGNFGLQHDGDPPTELYPDPSRYGRANMVNIKYPVQPRNPRDMATLPENWHLMKDPAYNRAYQQIVADCETDDAYGESILMGNGMEVGYQNRFGPAMLLKKEEFVPDYNF